MLSMAGLLSGFSLFGLFTWRPIWGLADAHSAAELFNYFVMVTMLLIGVIMVSGGRTAFRLSAFAPCFIAGIVCSFGYGHGHWIVVGIGVVGFLASWVKFGD